MTKLIGLQASNFKRLRAVDITFPTSGGALAVMGSNEAGKSSLLDALEVAIAGRKAPKMEQPIHAGADEARVIATFEDLVVTRRYKADGTTTIEAAGTDGRRFARTEEVLSALYNHVALDPLAFARLPDKEQVDTLLGLIGYDPSKLDAARAEAFELRTIVNREVKALAARVAALPPIDTKLPEEPVDIAALSERMAAALGATAEAERVADAHRRAVEDVQTARATLERARAELERQESVLAVAQEALDAVKAPEDPEPIRRQIEEARLTNQRVADNAERRRLAAEHTEKSAEADRLTARIAEIAAQKEAELAAASMPVPGLTISEDGILLLRGTPFSQASTGAQIRTGTAIAMALNPDLRVIVIRDASLLDAGNRETIDALAKANDFLVLMEIADTAGPVGIVIEDGAVAEVRS